MSVEQSLKTAEVFEPHVVLVDWMLPDVSGLELANRLREMPVGQPTKPISLSGDGLLDREPEAAIFDAPYLSR